MSAVEPPPMTTDALKWILMAVLFILTVFCGLLPLKLLGFLRNRGVSPAMIDRVVSHLSAFAGGIFLGVCLLDMLPDALEDYEEFKELVHYDGTYPWVFFACGLGFFLVYLMERLMHDLLGVQDAPEPPQPAKQEKEPGLTRTRTLTRCSTITALDQLAPKNEEHYSDKESRKRIRFAYIKSITFILALSLHVTLEGFALGIQKDNVSFLTLFMGIMLHKAVVVFSTGMRLTVTHHDQKAFVVVMIVIIAILAPAFGALGIIVQDAQMDAVWKLALTLSLTCISVGVFFYVTFFEILVPEEGTVPERLLTLLGFGVIAVTMIFAD